MEHADPRLLMYSSHIVHSKNTFVISVILFLIRLFFFVISVVLVFCIDTTCCCLLFVILPLYVGSTAVIGTRAGGNCRSTTTVYVGGKQESINPTQPHPTLPHPTQPISTQPNKIALLDVVGVSASQSVYS